jgi:hypothetical protein
MLLLFGLASLLILAFAGAAARAQQYDDQNMPPPDPYAQQQQDPYAQQQQDPYAQQQQPQYDPNYAQQDPNYAPQPQTYEYAFYGTHPVPYDQGGGYCYQQGPHYHPYAPFDQYLFRQSNGYYYFVGDPADFGYTQQLWGYNGNHPIPLAWGGGYCYISWPHRHPYAPSSGMYYNFVGGYYVYSGPWDPLYWRWRDHYYGYYGSYYRTNYYGGRYWTVRPPPVYRPTITIGAPGVRVVAPAPRVVVGAPGARVVVGAPGARVYAPAPRVVAPPAPRVYAPAPHVYAPPAPRVYAPPAPHVYAPAPRISAPAPVVSRPPPAPARVAPPPARHR